MGYNRLAPCSLTLPDDHFATHTDWFGSPTKRTLVHHGIEPPKWILADHPSAKDKYSVIVGRFEDDILTLYFGSNGWMGWQSAIDLRQPFRPCDIYIRLFFTTFLCQPNPKRVLIIGLGGGVWPLLIRHSFPSTIIDVVEIDETVIALAIEFFGLAEQCTHGHLNVGFRAYYFLISNLSIFSSNRLSQTMAFDMCGKQLTDMTSSSSMHFWKKPCLPI